MTKTEVKKYVKDKMELVINNMNKNKKFKTNLIPSLIDKTKIEVDVSDKKEGSIIVRLLYKATNQYYGELTMSDLLNPNSNSAIITGAIDSMKSLDKNILDYLCSVFSRDIFKTIKGTSNSMIVKLVELWTHLRAEDKNINHLESVTELCNMSSLDAAHDLAEYASKISEMAEKEKIHNDNEQGLGMASYLANQTLWTKDFNYHINTNEGWTHLITFLDKDLKQVQNIADEVMQDILSMMSATGKENKKFRKFKEKKSNKKHWN